MKSEKAEGMKVLGVSGSPRARFGDTDEAIRIIKRTESYQDLYTRIYELASYKKISNTEALLWMGLFGAYQRGAEIDLVHLRMIFNDKKEDEKENLKKKIENARGILLASPVYFGDYSSYMATFLQDCNLEERIVGVVSAGAKRNGGQETTNIFCLYEAMSFGANIVGNGPPTSQYGGTGWAGDVGAILDDNFGLDTSLGTGRRIAEILINNESDPVYPGRIGLITYEPGGEGNLERRVRNMLDESGEVTIRTVNIDKYEIHPCRGCAVCPYKEMSNGDYGCIQKDDMEKVNRLMWGLDAIVVVTDNDNLKGVFWKNFKVFIERTRYLRRGHFVLSDLPVFIIQRNNFRKNQNTGIRIVTFFLRHNTYICGPVLNTYYDDDNVIYQNRSLKEMCNKIIRYAALHKGAKAAGVLNGGKYVPIGYRGVMVHKQ